MILDAIAMVLDHGLHVIVNVSIVAIVEEYGGVTLLRFLPLFSVTVKSYHRHIWLVPGSLLHHLHEIIMNIYFDVDKTCPH